MRKGFTLIELIITVAIIVLLFSAYFFTANPVGQLQLARNDTRGNDLRGIMLALRQYISDQGNETFSCATAGPLPTTSTLIESNGGYNLAACLVPNYLPVLPVDPSASSAAYVSASNYNTGYAISQNSTDSITLSAPNAELNQTISVTR